MIGHSPLSGMNQSDRMQILGDRAGKYGLDAATSRGSNKDAVSAHNVRAVFPTIYANKDAPLPKRIVVVLAHWESDSSGFEISKTAEPEMFYDYYGLPGSAY